MTTPHDLEEQRAIMESLREDYPYMKMLEDGTIIAVHPLITTTSLIIGINRDSWERRYCYPTAHQATLAFNALRDGDDHPLQGWIARRH